MKFTIRGKGDIILNPQDDFIGGGGEGNVYGKKDLVYKIYHDTRKIISEGKVLELAVLDKDNILRPLDTLMKGNTRVGFTMHRVIDTYPLCKLFTQDFCHTNNVNDDVIIKLIEKIKHTIHFIHSKECLIVDGNEFNYLVSNNFEIPYFIDVDSYQTKSYSAQVIMDSIRDWHCFKFTELSDWFSFAIIACQLLAKIHPFKGKHDIYKTLEERMKHNVSIFNVKTRVPTMANIGAIPQIYRDWFYALFEQGKRTLPPDLVALPVQVIKQILKGSDAFDIDQIYECTEDILYYNYCFGLPVIKTNNEIIVGKRNMSVAKDTEVILGAQQLTPIFANIINNKLKLTTASNIAIFPINLDCTEKIVIANTLFVKNGENLIELYLDDSGLRIIPSVKVVWNIMPNSSTIFSGVIYQSVLGKPFLVIPRPNRAGASKCHIMPVKELEDYRIINAKHDNGVCILIGHKNNRYDRIILKYSSNYTTYNCKVVEDIDSTSVNFITLDNGIVVNLIEDTIEIFSKDLNNKSCRVVEDTGLVNVKLTKNGSQVLFIQDNKVYSIKMKKGA
jgi:hypothetical protein